MVGEVRHPARDPPLPPARRRQARPAPRHPLLDPGRRRRRGTTPLATWRIHHHGRRHHVPLVRHGHRLPVDAEGARHRRHRALPGRGVLHQPLAARGRRPHRQAGRRHRHRLVGHPVDPDDGQAGLPAHRVPAHAQLLPAGPQRARPRRHAGRPRAGPGRVPRGRRAGPAAACRSSQPARRRSLSATRSAAPASSRRGRPAGSSRSSAATRTSEPAGQRRAGRVHARARSARSCTTRRRPRRCARRPPVRHQAPLPRHQLLRDLQPPPRAPGEPAQDPITTITETGIDPATSPSSSTSSSSPRASTP